MVKKFTINCNFKDGQNSPVTFFIGNPSDKSNAIHFQSKWLADRGGSVPEDIIKSFEQLQEIAIRDRVEFEELAEFVLEEIKHNRAILADNREAYAALSQATSTTQKINNNNDNK